MHETVDEVGRVADQEGIDCHYAKGGTSRWPRTRPPAEAAAQLDEARAFGFGDDDVRWLDRGEARALVGADGVLGALSRPLRRHPARPSRRGLANVVERRGVTIHESTPVTSIEPGTVRTGHGVVRAGVVVRATEGFTPQLPGEKRTLAPVYSLMVATEPLPAALWDELGMASRPTFNDARHLIIYGQRTADGRMAFGGRGAPYHFGSPSTPPSTATRRSSPSSQGPPLAVPGAARHRVHPRLGWAPGHPTRLALLGRARPRDRPGLGRRLRRRRVATTNLAGRTLAELITGRTTDLARLPWVDHRSPPVGARAVALARHQRARSASPRAPMPPRPGPVARRAGERPCSAGSPDTDGPGPCPLAGATGRRDTGCHGASRRGDDIRR